MPDLTFDVKIDCEVCGYAMDIEQAWSGTILITPCSRCMEDAYNNGRKAVEVELTE